MPTSCPKCKSDMWKSARLVIMEGSTSSQSNITGTITERGSLSGDPKDWYLADRWFSYESPVEAEMTTTTSSLVVDQIKGMLVSAAEGRALPEPPSEPILENKAPAPQKEYVSKPNFLKQDPSKRAVKVAPPKPSNPIDSLEPFQRQSWFTNYASKLGTSFMWIAASSGAISYMLPKPARATFDLLIQIFQFAPAEHERFLNVQAPFEIWVPYISDMFQTLSLSDFWFSLLGMVLLILSLTALRGLVLIPASFSFEKKRAEKYRELVEKTEEKYAAALKEHKDKLTKITEANQQRDLDIQQYNERQELYQKEVAEAEVEYQKLLAMHEEEVASTNEILATQRKNYLAKYAEYEAEVAQVKAFRNELWDRARMCTRCGEVYLGEHS